MRGSILGALFTGLLAISSLSGCEDGASDDTNEYSESALGKGRGQIVDGGACVCKGGKSDTGNGKSDEEHGKKRDGGGGKPDDVGGGKKDGGAGKPDDVGGGKPDDVGGGKPDDMDMDADADADGLDEESLQPRRFFGDAGFKGRRGKKDGGVRGRGKPAEDCTCE
jgi:hypothetical protein